MDEEKKKKVVIRPKGRKPKPIPHFQIVIEPNFGPASLVLEKDFEFATMQELMDMFYFHNDVPQLAPISFQNTPSGSSDREEGWYLIFYQRFFIHITHGLSMFGPHLAKLKYSPRGTSQIYWVATLQLEHVFFFSEEAILLKITQAIRDRTFYITTRELKLRIIL